MSSSTTIQPTRHPVIEKYFENERMTKALPLMAVRGLRGAVGQAVVDFV